MKVILYIMECQDNNGEYSLWFNEDKKLIGGYFANDANWRSEYFDPIFKKVGVKIKSIPYDEEIAKKSCKKLWGLNNNE